MVRDNTLTAELRRRRTEVLLDLDNGIAEAVFSLSDYVPAHEVKGFVAAIFSVMLSSIVLDDTSEAGDAIDRLIANYSISPSYSQKLWGEFLAVLTAFYEYYRYHDIIIDTLRDLLGSGVFDVDAEVMFSVEVKGRGRYLLVR